MAIAAQRLGIGIHRQFTTPGEHPYDTVVWERRDARIVNWATGAVAFEQAGVEVPAGWSLNATNILAQKYFRGTLGTAEREWSLKQVADRVVDTITGWGRLGGYFVDDDEADIFSDELRYLIVHQKAAFNSPVWFNIGVEGVPQQGSACQPYDALVSTPEGLVPIGRLVESNAVGEKVYDADGVTRIVAVKANGRKPVLRLHTKSGLGLDVTADHLVWRASGEGTGRFVPAGELKAGDSLTWHRTESFDMPALGEADVEYPRIAQIEALADAEVYDIQTESGEYLSENLRVHNCFILSVEDSMDSILRWYTEEGIIFKGGSGAGVNLSRIRSSREGLRGGGTASGPVSFMRGADASAGTIKSGGKTRRAAKMVILNADHPDIEDFIWCKAIEERKARALRDAGFDMDLDGRDSHSIQYQNANNSVRVTDEFMQAVLDDADWHLRAITTGGVVETLRARDLYRQIAKAAWECADPGMQFDTTINRWHTAPNHGRINASNPCSEYLHVDDSACNLASLNLLTYLGDDGSFDVQGFKAATEVVFTAQEIIVGSADYPTEKIAENSRRFRQLGIGYANLGALLMAQGLPYDSDAGRAWAAALTALLTGHSYATSARTAARMGPFAGYQANRDAMLNVLRMHREEAARIDEELVPPELLSAAQESWDAAVDTAQQYGVRNSQASVLAPTGCLVGGSLVATGRGLVRLASLGDPEGPQWQDLDTPVATDAGPQQAARFYVNGLDSVVSVDTVRGYRVQGTPQHRIRVVDPLTGEWVWKRFSDLATGDLVPLAFDQLVGDPQVVPLPALADAYWTGEHHARAPREMTSELAELIGYFMGDGSLHSRGLRLCVTACDSDVAARLRDLAKSCFGLEARVTTKKGYVEVRIDSVRLAMWWEACGFAKHHNPKGRGKGYVSHFPDAVLHANDPAVYGAFLRGLFEADGDTSAGYPTLKNTSLQMVRDAQAVLLALGFPTAMSVRERSGSWGAAPLARLRLLNASYSERWLRSIGFMGERKSSGVAVPTTTQAGRRDYVPLTRDLIDRLAPANDRLRKVLLLENARGKVSRRVTTQLYDRTGDHEVGRLLSYFYDRVARAELTGEEFTYDISVPANVTYIANGFVSHNTIGLLMDCDTTGIEPDLGLAKTKKLVGGGTMSIVNQTVPRALAALGYEPYQVSDIVSYIDEHKSIVGAPHLSTDHLPVFACSMGDNTIHYRGHVRMMGAVQPFISGAISKCVAGETLVASADGLVRIGSMRQGEPVDSFRSEVLEVASLGGPAKTDAFYYGGVRAVRAVTLRSGHKVVGTANHRLLSADGGTLAWKRLDEISEGDWIAVRYGDDLWSSLPARFDDFRPSPLYGSQRSVRLPEEMTEDLALVLGAYASGGHTTRSVWTVSITNSVDTVLEQVAAAVERVFGIPSAICRPKDRCPSVKVHSKTVVEFLEYLGCGGRASDKRIPDAVLRSPRAQVLAFLRGLALDADCIADGSTKWAICTDSPAMLDDLQAVLTNLGVLHSRVSKANYRSEEVCATGDQAQKLVALVPFLEPDKGVRLPSWLQAIDDDLHFSPVSRVVDGGFREVFDLSVPSTHAFVGNGIVNHNTVNMPEEALVEDVEQLYIEAWQLGLKAVAIYRDNCKVGQPLATAKKAAAGQGASPAEAHDAELAVKVAELEQALERRTVVVKQPIRERLPRKRKSLTFAFRVADCEGYVTVGEYDDGRPGEVFMKVSKQGSTLSGIMDAFSIAISLGLQHGVPLATYVRKYTNMRFEPAGMTDDPDLRIAQSLVDYIFRRLAVDYLPYEERGEMGVLTTAERTQPTLPGVEEATTPSSSVVETARTPASFTSARAPGVVESDAPYCFQCGVQMIRAGSCHACPSCGTTSGCS
ncbi:MAG: LAGLIDADG family homing endonuclease [Acidimicrobiales bacterium]